MLVAGLSLVGFIFASANHRAPVSHVLGAGSVSPSTCTTPTAINITYNLDSSGNLSSTNGVVVGDLSSACSNGTLQVELNGTAANLPLNLSGTVTAAICTGTSTLTCTLPVTKTVAPANVSGNYVSITGP